MPAKLHTAIVMSTLFVSAPSVVHTQSQSFDVFRRDLEEGKTERLAADDTIPDRPFGFDLVATDITPRAGKVALLTRADLEPEQDVGFFVADVYVLDGRER